MLALDEPQSSSRSDQLRRSMMGVVDGEREERTKAIVQSSASPTAVVNHSQWWSFCRIFHLKFKSLVQIPYVVESLKGLNFAVLSELPWWWLTLSPGGSRSCVQSPVWAILAGSVRLASRMPNDTAKPGMGLRRLLGLFTPILLYSFMFPFIPSSPMQLREEVLVLVEKGVS